MIDHLVHPIPMMCMILYSFVYFALPFLWQRGIIQGRSIWIIVTSGRVQVNNSRYIIFCIHSHLQPPCGNLWQQTITGISSQFLLATFRATVCLGSVGPDHVAPEKEQLQKLAEGTSGAIVKEHFWLHKKKTISNWAGFTMDRFNNADAPIMQLQWHKNSRSHGLRL